MGPLQGIRVVEFAGIGPAPVCAMLLADLGAMVIRIDRTRPSGLGISRPLRFDVALRGRKSIHVDLKASAGIALALDLVSRADALVEGFRPGVMERLGLGPEECLRRNPKLVYGRVTGWGQDGPLAQCAGHDINFIALPGLLSAIGRSGAPPTVPLNVIGDYAGGSLYLALGILAGILEARSSGKGQVVDAAIVDGVASLMTVLVGLRGAGMIGRERGTNYTDSGAPFYDVYQCADGEYVSIGPIERKFQIELLERLEISAPVFDNPLDKRSWPEAKRILAARFKTKTRAEWTALLQGTDACFAPVLDLEEAYEDPHLKARNTFMDVGGVMQPSPAPRFSRSRTAVPEPPSESSPQTAVAALRAWLTEPEIEAHCAAGALT
jgi:alpha-methylacyl-CoA racemase